MLAENALASESACGTWVRPRSPHLSSAHIPRYARAVIEALQFTTPNSSNLELLDENEWNQLLSFCDRAQLTLLLGNVADEFLPDRVRARIERNYADNACRFDRLQSIVVQVATALKGHSVDFTLLKGFAHAPAFTPDPLLRAQADIDLWCLPDTVFAAQDILFDLGYRPIARSTSRHLDPMARPMEWTWRGNFFDPDLPIAIDLHYTLWDEDMEQILGLREDELWLRRSTMLWNGMNIRVLSPADALAFAALHAMMHLLHGDLRLQRVWELAYVLNSRDKDDEFWRRWQGTHLPEARKPHLVAFLLADQWFRCGLPELIQDEARSLSPDLGLWIERYGFSPVESLFHPNKNELWLNVCLLNSLRSKITVCCRRLLPLSSGLEKAAAQDGSGGRNSKGRTSKIAFLSKRAWLHARTLVPTCLQGLQWWWVRRQLGREFFRFLMVSVLFDFGEFIFFLLYNLYLLDLGRSEKFLGQVSAALTAGTFIAILPVAAVTRRLGLRNSLLIAILGTATATTLRAVLPWAPALLFSAFLNGLFMSFWAVILPPAVAGLTNSRNRTLAFSLITSMGIGTGSLAGVIGGRLPKLVLNLIPRFTSVQGKQLALIIGSILAALALFPALSLRFSDMAPERLPAKKIYPRGRFVYSFLLAWFMYSVGTGGFNPFFNAYFSKHVHMSVEAIGSVFSYGQLLQVFVILFAPTVLKKFGDVKAITSMQAATAAMLCLLAVIASPTVAALVYIAYVCFQYMSEPCLLSMLMSRVPAGEQSGASAMNFMVAAAAGILSSMAAGAMFSRFGYTATMATCALTIALAAALFYGLFRRGTHQ